MKELLTGLALVLVFEGIAYALFPTMVRRAAARAALLPDGLLRGGGLAAAVIGVALVWLIRGSL